jgi:hypothetical protein
MNAFRPPLDPVLFLSINMLRRISSMDESSLASVPDDFLSSQKHSAPTPVVSKRTEARRLRLRPDRSLRATQADAHAPRRALHCTGAGQRQSRRSRRAISRKRSWVCLINCRNDSRARPAGHPEAERRQRGFSRLVDCLSENKEIE